MFGHRQVRLRIILASAFACISVGPHCKRFEMPACRGRTKGTRLRRVQSCTSARKLSQNSQSTLGRLGRHWKQRCQNLLWPASSLGVACRGCVLLQCDRTRGLAPSRTAAPKSDIGVYGWSTGRRRWLRCQLSSGSVQLASATAWGLAWLGQRA